MTAPASTCGYTSSSSEIPVRPARARLTAAVGRRDAGRGVARARTAGGRAAGRDDRRGIESVLTGRTQTSDADLWAPHYLVMGVPPTQAQADRLVALARSRYRIAVGYVIAGDVAGATWTWDYGEDGRVQAGVLGFDLAVQLLPPAQYAALIRLFGSTSNQAKVSLAGGLAPAGHLSAAAGLPIEVTMLGPGAVWASGPMEPERQGLATEIVMYLAAHPDGVHRTVLTGAIWPRGVSDDVRDAALARVPAWLGPAADGTPNLVGAEDGRVGLGRGVRVDWRVFRAFMARASAAAAAGDTPSETGFLRQALAQVRGQFLDGREPDRYSWLAADDIEYEVTALVADAAHRLSSLLLEGSDAEGAMTPARAGLKLAFNDEALWRDLLLGAHATGRSTCCASWSASLRPGWRSTTCCHGWRRRPRRSSTNSCRPGGSRRPEGGGHARRDRVSADGPTAGRGVRDPGGGMRGQPGAFVRARWRDVLSGAGVRGPEPTRRVPQPPRLPGSGSSRSPAACRCSSRPRCPRAGRRGPR